MTPQVTTEKQREAFKEELAQTEDWLYEDGEAQSAAVFKYAAWPHIAPGGLACVASPDPVPQHALVSMAQAPGASPPCCAVPDSHGKRSCVVETTPCFLISNDLGLTYTTSLPPET